MNDTSKDGSNLVGMLRDYEKQLAHLKQEVAILTLHNKEYVKSTKVIADENKQLHVEIQDLIDEQMTKLTEHTNQTDDGAIRNLMKQLELAHKERDAAISMNKETMQQLDNIRKESTCVAQTDQSKNRIFNETKRRVDTLEEANLQMQILIESLQEENRTLSNTTSQQMRELKSTHDESRDLKQKLVESYRKQEEDKKALTSLSLKSNDLESSNLDLILLRDQMKTKNQQLQSSLAEAEGKLAQALQSASDSHFQVDNLKVRMVALEKLNSDIEAKEIDYLMQLRQSAQLLDDALLARDTALANSQKTQEDLSKASAAMETLVQEVADRVKCEVDKVKSQCCSNIRRLMDDLECLELENTNLRSESERARRDKRAVEDEMDVLRHQQYDVRERVRIDEMQKRTIHAERARDDLLITVDKLEEKLKRETRAHSDEKTQLLNGKQKLEQRVKRLERETDENRHERFQLLESINRCKSEKQKLEELARSARLNAAKEFTLTKETMMKEKKQLEVRLSSIESSHEANLRKLHKMLADQQRVAARWKDENKHACEIYEDKVKTLQSQLARSRRKCQELINKLKTAPGVNNDEASRLEDENRLLRADLHQSHYQTLSLAQKLTHAQSLSNSLGVRDL